MATNLPAGLVPGTYVVDGSHSTASFTVRHAGIAKVRGTIAITSGAIIVGDNLESSSVSAELDAASVNTGDANRDAHLRSADFWNAEEKPVRTFTSTGVKVAGDDYVITGDLTIKDVTKNITIPFAFEGVAVDPFGNTRVGFEGSVVINRKDFGVSYNAALETGGVLVGDKIKISLDISGIKQA